MLHKDDRYNALLADGSPDGRVRIGYVSTYPPRQCGIATFCEDVLTNAYAHPMAGDPLVVAITRQDEPHDYQWPVGQLLREDSPEDWARVGDYLNHAPVDVVSIQHEFGICGGPKGIGLWSLLDRLDKPVVTTLHTVLPDPSEEERATIRRLAERSQRVVVMNDLARDILRDTYGIDGDTVAFIHHGAPPPAKEDADEIKAALGLSGRKVLSTFGLVGPGKGLEYVLRALPAIRREHPEVIYLIIGKTHPGIQRSHRETYRDHLASLADDLGIADCVRFINAYQSKADIIRYLAATDIYITPYLNPAQICSGTLAYAMAAGKAIVSTPYLYARFLLADGRGRLVEFRDPGAIAWAVNEILADASLQAALEARARAYGRGMYWPVVAQRFVDLCAEAASERVAVSEAALVGDRRAPYADHEGGGWHARERRQADVAGALAAAD